MQIILLQSEAKYFVGPHTTDNIDKLSDLQIRVVRLDENNRKITPSNAFLLGLCSSRNYSVGMYYRHHNDSISPGLIVADKAKKIGHIFFDDEGVMRHNLYSVFPSMSTLDKDQLFNTFELLQNPVFTKVDYRRSHTIEDHMGNRYHFQFSEDNSPLGARLTKIAANN